MKFMLFTYLLLLSLLSFGQKDSSKIFEESKGKWPVPVAKYVRIYNNENLKHSTVNQFDSTLRIITDSAYEVRAVHEGTIAAIIKVEDGYTLLTKFGDYFIAYSRMTKPCLKEGAFLRSGQSLGPLVKDFSEDNYTVEIILSKGTKQISAAKWIAW